MSARLVYRNSTPEAMAWAADYKARSTAIHEARFAWTEALYDEHGVPEKERGAFVRGDSFSGIAWPNDMPLPDGWFRPVKTPQLIRPRADRKGNPILKQMAAFSRPDARLELREQLGMPYHLFVGLGMYQPGLNPEDDGVWVTWGSKDCEDGLEAAKVGDYGWQRIPLTEVIERFGEDAL